MEGWSHRCRRRACRPGDDRAGSLSARPRGSLVAIGAPARRPSLVIQLWYHRLGTVLLAEGEGRRGEPQPP